MKHWYGYGVRVRYGIGTMKSVEPMEELPDAEYESVDSDEDPEEDPEEEDPEDEYEEYEEVSEEETEADPDSDLEGEESNAERNKESGSANNHSEDLKRAISKAVDQNVDSEELDVKNASGKRRRSRWDLPTDQVEALAEGDTGRKIRKTRWGSDVPPLETTAPIQLPESMSDLLDSELIQKLKKKVLDINKELVRLEVHHANPTIEESRRKQEEKLVRKRKNILREMVILTSKLRMDDRKHDKFVKKVYIPVKEYPSYNFVGQILGPRGNTQKKMEVESGASIKLRGKGSTVKDRKVDPSDDEELHVYIEAHTRISLDTAVAMIEKILIPVEDGSNEFKRAQLEELARLNGTLHASHLCNECQEPGHKSYACPNRESTFEKVTACTKCGSLSHGVSQCPVKTNPKLNKEINEANLYIGYLPQTVDENRLKELFCPFGKIARVAVIMDTITGLSKGYAFVNFESPIDAAVAVKHMNGYQIDGKMLAVRVAGLPPQPKIPLSNPIPPYPRPMGPWVGLIGPPPQQGFPALNPIPPYPRPVLISPNISSQTGPWVGPTGSFLSNKEPIRNDYNLSSSKAMGTPSHFDPSYVYSKQAIYSASVSSQFPGDPDYRGSSSLFPGDPDYRGSGSSSLFTSDFGFSK